MSSHAQTPGVPTGPHLDNRRIAAALIDLGVPLAMVAAAYAAGLSMTRGLVLVGLGWTLYYFFALESGEGQTLGKRVMKLRVVSADGSPATMEQIAKRTLVRILDGHIVGLVVMLATGERRQRLGDILAGTMVTEAGPVVAPPLEAESEAEREVGVEPEPPGEPSAEPVRRKLRKPSFSKPALGRLSLRRPRPPGPVGETPPRKLSRGLASLRLPALRLPSLRRRTDAAERHEPTRESPTAATPVQLDGTEPTVELDYRIPAGGTEPTVELDHGEPAADPHEPAAEPHEFEPHLPLESHEVLESHDDRAPYDDGEPVAELEGPEPVVSFDDRGEAWAHEHSEPVPEVETVEPLVELETFEPLPGLETAEPEPLVELDREPVVELDEPLVGFEEREPVVELDMPFAGYEEREPVVELDEPFAGDGVREPVVEVDEPFAGDGVREPVVEVDEPFAGDGEREPVVQLDEPEPEPHSEPHSEPPAAPESPPEPAQDEELTVKPIETVSAIDLVMQDAEARRLADR